ncbi:MAG: amidase [Pseudomonadota bacterium]
MPTFNADPITAETLRAAERLAQVTFSDPARDMVLEDIENQLTRALAVRALNIPNAIAPASRFAPLVGDRQGPRRLRRRPRIFTDLSAIPCPSDPSDVAFASTLQQSQWLRAGVLTSVALTEIYLERIARLDATLNAFISVFDESAMAAARQADEEIAAGQSRGPLHGIPWAAKDLLATQEGLTTWGATPYREQQFDVDATVVRRLADQGAVLLGKTALGALALGDVWFGGQTRNPHNVEEGSAGSSAGSAAAVAAGLASFAIGSETMGSIVNPSLRCGVWGLRPTYGRVPRTGAMALSWSLDKLGPIVRAPEDAIAVLADIAGPDGDDLTIAEAPLNYDAQSTVEGLRIGVNASWWESETSHLDEPVLKTLDAAGVSFVDVDLPELPYDALWAVLFSEAAAAFDDLIVRARDTELERQDRYAWPNLLKQARYLSAVDHLQAERFRTMVMTEFDRVFTRVDLLLGSMYAPHVQLITNCTGHPALAMPTSMLKRPSRVGFNPIGTLPPTSDAQAFRVPHGLVVWGDLYREDLLARIGKHLYADAEHHRNDVPRPAI